MSRGRSDDMQTIEELRIRDERELGWGLQEAMDVADIVIENTSTLEEFKKQIIDLME
jgi:dephospho-CoA kinase